MMRSYRIEDDGDEVHVALFEDDMQMGAAMFPDDGSGDAFDLAYELAEEWVGHVQV